MIEVEVKARAEEGTRERIASLGATPIQVENHLDLYFNSPLRDLKTSDEALRIRIKEDGARLTYKGPRLDQKTKSRQELTVKIDDPVRMGEILSLLGFVPSAELRKKRTKYSYQGMVIALDEVEGLGSFLEVEARGGEDWEREREQVLSVLEQLGLGETIRCSYLELLEEKRGKSRSGKDGGETVSGP